MLKAGTLELEASQRMTDILGVLGDKQIGALESVQKFQEKLRKALADGGDGIPEQSEESVSGGLSDDDEVSESEDVPTLQSLRPGTQKSSAGGSRAAKAAPTIEVGDVESENEDGTAERHEEATEAAKSKRTTEESEQKKKPKLVSKPKKSKQMAAVTEEKQYEFSPRTERLLAHFVRQQQLKMRKNERAGRSYSENQRMAGRGDAVQKLDKVMGILRECFDQSKEDEEIKDIDARKKEMRDYNEQVNTTVTQLQENLVLFDPAAHQKDQLLLGDKKFDPEEIMKDYIRSEHENFENFFQPKPELEEIVEKLEHTQFVRKLLRGRCGWNI